MSEHMVRISRKELSPSSGDLAQVAIRAGVPEEVVYKTKISHVEAGEPFIFRWTGPEVMDDCGKTEPETSVVDILTVPKGVYTMVLTANLKREAVMAALEDFYSHASLVELADAILAHLGVEA